MDMTRPALASDACTQVTCENHPGRSKIETFIIGLVNKGIRQEGLIYWLFVKISLTKVYCTLIGDKKKKKLAI